MVEGGGHIWKRRCRVRDIRSQVVTDETIEQIHVCKEVLVVISHDGIVARPGHGFVVIVIVTEICNVM